MGEREDLEFRMHLEGARQTEKGLKDTAKATDKLGDETRRTGREQEQAGRKARFFARSTDLQARAAGRAKGKLKGLGKEMLTMGAGFAAAAAGFASISGLKSSVDRTVELTGAAAALSSVYGLNTQAASEYAIVADTLGVEQKALYTGMLFMSKNAMAAQQQYGKLSGKKADYATKVARVNRELTKLARTEKNADKRAKLELKVRDLQGKAAQQAAGKQAAAFAKVGVSLEMLKRGNATEIFQTAAEGLKQMEGGPEKAATQMLIFGKGATAIRPMLAQGAKGIDEWRAKAAGAAEELDPEKFAEYRKNQREMKLVWTEISVVVGSWLLPKLVQLGDWTQKQITNFRTFKGSAGDLRVALQAIGRVAGFVKRHWKGTATVVGAAINLPLTVSVAVIGKMRGHWKGFFSWLANAWNTFARGYNKGVGKFNSIPGAPDIGTLGLIDTTSGDLPAPVAGPTLAPNPAVDALQPTLRSDRSGGLRSKIAAATGGAETVNLVLNDEVVAKAVRRDGKWRAARA